MRPAASSRSFGFLLAAASLTFCTMDYWLHGRISVIWGVLGGLTLMISLFLPRLLAPIKRAWLKLGALLGQVISPIALGLIYILAIVPVGTLARLARKDLLSLRRD